MHKKGILTRGTWRSSHEDWVATEFKKGKSMKGKTQESELVIQFTPSKVIQPGEQLAHGEKLGEGLRGGPGGRELKNLSFSNVNLTMGTEKQSSRYGKPHRGAYAPQTT